jgi:hypothetical protein
MTAIQKGDRVWWQDDEWIVSSVFDTNTEGFRANLLGPVPALISEVRRVSVQVSDVEKLEGGDA